MVFRKQIKLRWYCLWTNLRLIKSSPEFSAVHIFLHLNQLKHLHWHLHLDSSVNSIRSIKSFVFSSMGWLRPVSSSECFLEQQEILLLHHEKHVDFISPLLRKCRITENMSDIRRNPINIPCTTIFISRYSCSLERNFFKRKVLYKFTLISNLVPDYIQKRRSQILFTSFEYNLLATLRLCAAADSLKKTATFVVVVI